MVTPDDQLEKLLRAVQCAEKYKNISQQLVRDIGGVELSKRKSLKEAIKATRSKLHQIGSAFQEKQIPYPKWMSEVEQSPGNLNAPEVLAFIKGCQSFHSSTLERLPYVERFFYETLVSISPIQSILDLACGLNPLSIPWMPVSENISYSGCDIYRDMTGFLSSFMNHFRFKSEFQVCDMSKDIPQEKVQVAFLLKTIPCLEQLDKGAGKRLLDGLHAENILVSFPSHSLSGRSKGMVQNYEAHFNELVEGKNWRITRYQFPSELAFLIQK
jgi:16S rRNA (guanine(1405)-N(7))-methyltransferase